ncbi:hypothetical protein QJS04_geneDACA012079 [Acorus gramineus]|uniref:RNA exonuclease 4 n=1 Tax=Acorus gramineus TaxID=55184 RepID=A0AAV9B9J1_ACOGR|nr:hypothetical protein QJS04_geneDACA012079 [Acorus gramineus]
MDPKYEPPQTLTRSKCSACYKQYKKKDHLIKHMIISYHSVHDPACTVCKKHCKTLESVREHLSGPLAKADCVKVFVERGCILCLCIFDSLDVLKVHEQNCRLSPVSPVGFGGMTLLEKSTRSEMEIRSLSGESCCNQGLQVVAMDCEMVGVGSVGSSDACARVCLIDEDENVLFHSYVKPELPVKDYRYEITGITEDHFQDALSLKKVRVKIKEILYNAESCKARILVGHSLDHDLYCLRMTHPEHLKRDTAIYPPLMKTNLVSHSLKDLTRTYLGYEIQTGTHDPFEDCVAVMRLYKRMRGQVHRNEAFSPSSGIPHSINSFDAYDPNDLMKMSPDALLQISRPKYMCWCLDLRRASDTDLDSSSSVVSLDKILDGFSLSGE